jgi:hypothetical protein
MAVVRSPLCNFYAIPVVDLSRVEYILTSDRTHIPAADIQVPGVNYEEIFKFGVYQLNMRQPTADQFNAMSSLSLQFSDEIMKLLATNITLTFNRSHVEYGVHHMSTNSDGYAGSVLCLSIKHMEVLLKAQLAESERLVVQFHIAVTVRAFSHHISYTWIPFD